MHSTAPRRTLSLESLEYRITPTVLGLSLPILPGPLAELTSQLGLASPTPASPGNSGPSLGVDVGLLSLQAGVGSGGGLLSLGVALDPPLLPPLAPQAGVGSPQGPLSGGVALDPPALPRSPGVDPGGVLPPPNGPTVSPPSGIPPSNSPPSGSPQLAPVLQTSLPAASTPGTPAPANVPLPVVAPQPVTPVGTTGGTATTGAASVVDIGVTNAQGPAGTAGESSSTTLQSPRVNDMTFASFSALPPRPTDVAPPRAESSGDDLEEELFQLRDGDLLEDFGTAIAAEDAGLVSDIGGDASQGENADAVALWLVGMFAGCVGGSAWLTTQREREADPMEADPCLLPLE